MHGRCLARFCHWKVRINGIPKFGAVEYLPLGQIGHDPFGKFVLFFTIGKDRTNIARPFVWALLASKNLTPSLGNPECATQGRLSPLEWWKRPPPRAPPPELPRAPPPRWSTWGSWHVHVRISICLSQVGLLGEGEMIKTPIIIEGVTIERGEMEKLNNLKYIYISTVLEHKPCSC